MLCLPGLTPVANEAHAVGDSGDCVVAKGYVPPRAASCAMFGSCPAASHRFSSVGSMPSKPRMTKRCEKEGGDPGAQVVKARAAPRTAITSPRCQRANM